MLGHRVSPNGRPVAPGQSIPAGTLGSGLGAVVPVFGGATSVSSAGGWPLRPGCSYWAHVQCVPTRGAGRRAGRRPLFVSPQVSRYRTPSQSSNGCIAKLPVRPRGIPAFQPTRRIDNVANWLALLPNPVTSRGCATAWAVFLPAPRQRDSSSYRIIIAPLTQPCRDYAFVALSRSFA